jgi:hypothetical protein
MSPEDLLARHPAIREAVAFVEFYEVLPDLLEAVHGGMTLEGVVQLLSEAIDEGIAEDTPPNVPAPLKARGQFRLPEFGAYLAGRLGLM